MKRINLLIGIFVLLIVSVKPAHAQNFVSSDENVAFVNLEEKIMMILEGVDQTVKVKNIMGPAIPDSLDIEPGDIVYRLNDTDLESLDHFKNLFEDLELDSIVRLALMRNEKNVKLTFKKMPFSPFFIRPDN